MIKRLNEDVDNFDEVDFSFCIEDICEKVVSYLENHYPAQIIERKFPSYEANWCAESMSHELEIARDKAIQALTDYQILTLLYNKDEYTESVQPNKVEEDMF